MGLRAGKGLPPLGGQGHGNGNLPTVDEERRDPSHFLFGP